MKTNIMLAALVCGIIGAAPGPASANPAGEELYQSVCRNCHGPTAKGLASYPKLTGQTPEYLTEKLERYRAGEKIGPNSPLMIPHAAKLSDQDIADIVTYITTTFN